MGVSWVGVGGSTYLVTGHDLIVVSLTQCAQTVLQSGLCHLCADSCENSGSGKIRGGTTLIKQVSMGGSLTMRERVQKGLCFLQKKSEEFEACYFMWKYKPQSSTVGQM